jgi:transcription elongation GreA/GreB family factor
MQGSTETTNSPATNSVIAELQKLAAGKHLDRLESVWIEAAENAQLVRDQLEGFLEVAEAVLGAEKDPSRAGALLELLQGAINESASPVTGLRYLGLLVRANPGQRQHRAEFAERFEKLYPLASPERAFYEASGFAASPTPAAALVRLERLLKFREGAFVYHASGWGVGKVTAVDPFLKQVKVDLEQKKDHRIAINVVDTILEPLAPDSFRVLSFLGGEGLRALRDENPVRLVALVCETFGNTLPLKDIKGRLVPTVVGTGAWTKWWNRTKGLLRETGYFRVGDRAPYTVEKLNRVISYEDELLRDFLRADWPQARQIARQFSRRAQGELEAAWPKVKERLQTYAAASDAAVAIEAALILERCDASAGRETLAAVATRLKPQDLAKTLERIAGAEDQRRAIEALPDVRPQDWIEVAQALFAAVRDSVREPALDVLEKQAPERAQALVRDLLKSPKSSPEAFCHLLNAFLASEDKGTPPRWRSLEAFQGRGDRALLILVLDLFDHLQHVAERRGRVSFKEIMARVEDILTGRHCKLFASGIEQMGGKEIQEVYHRLMRNEAVDPHVKVELTQRLAEIDPTLHQQPELPPWEEDAIYVLPPGLEKKKDEFREIMEVKLPKVFEDIGRAAAFGDLSENAEYTAALEERDQLTKRATKMKADLDRAKLITAEKVKQDVSSLGSRLRVLNLRTNEEHVYSLLGPWDGVPEAGVLNYLSPLGRLFYGKKVGDEVEAQLPGGVEHYRILAVGSHFDP